MNERHNPFAGINSLPDFEKKPKRNQTVANDAIDRMADENEFHSRPAVRSARTPKRKARVHRTGRNVHMNIKMTQATQDRFYKLADRFNLVLGALLEKAFDALEKVEP
jgi:hypothetical protein